MSKGIASYIAYMNEDIALEQQNQVKVEYVYKSSKGY